VSSPPRRILERLLALRTTSPCAKSQRGVVIFDPRTLSITGSGYNAPPCPLTCDRSEACRRDCSKICVHAEQMAISNAMHSMARVMSTAPGLTGLHLVHGKFVAGELVAGGGPSCWQCSKQILEHLLAGVWLFEDGQHPAWNFYTALDFHQATLKACGLHDNLARVT